MQGNTKDVSSLSHKTSEKKHFQSNFDFQLNWHNYFSPFPSQPPLMVPVLLPSWHVSTALCTALFLQSAVDLLSSLSSSEFPLFEGRSEKQAGTCSVLRVRNKSFLLIHPGSSKKTCRILYNKVSKYQPFNPLRRVKRYSWSTVLIIS